MKLIAHRGNTNGSNHKLENSPAYIQAAIDKGFRAEIDVFYLYDKLQFGHAIGESCYEFDQDFLNKNKLNLLIHCKDIESLRYFSTLKAMGQNFNFFFHDREDYVLTSWGELISHSRNCESWLYPSDGCNLIQMLPEKHSLGKDMVSQCEGVCSDFIEWYK